MQITDLFGWAVACIMVSFSFIVARKIAPNQRVPMQFAPGGVAVWSAPKWVALSFLPFLAFAFDILYIVISSGASSNLTAGETLLVNSLRVPTAIVFGVVHVLHLYAATRWLARQR